MKYVVNRCDSCNVQVFWEQRDRFSFGWFHGSPGPDCSHGQYLASSDVERIDFYVTHPGTSVPADSDDQQNVGSKPEALGYHVCDGPEEWKKVDFR